MSPVMSAMSPVISCEVELEESSRLREPLSGGSEASSRLREASRGGSRCGV